MEPVNTNNTLGKQDDVGEASMISGLTGRRHADLLSQSVKDTGFSGI